MNFKYQALQPSKQKIYCQIRVLVFDRTEWTYCTKKNKSVNYLWSAFMCCTQVQTQALASLLYFET